MTDSLRTRIAAALVEVLKSDPEGFANEYEPCDDDGNPCGATLLRIDSVLDPQALADAVIAELNQPECGGCRDLGGHSPRCHTTEGTPYE